MFKLLKKILYPSINRLLFAMLLLLVPALLLIAQDVALLVVLCNPSTYSTESS